MSKKLKIKTSSGQRKKGGYIAGRAGKYPQQGLLQQALALQHAGNLSQAEFLYRQILEANPYHPETLHYLGMLSHQMGKSDKAIELIRKAVNARPKYIDAHFNLAVILFSQGRLDEAATSFRQLLTVQPNNAEAHYLLGVLLQEQGKKDKAEASFRRALDLKPDFSEAHNDLGNILQEQSKLEEAVACYLRAIAVKADNAKAHFNLAKALQAQGKLDEAVASFRRALSLKPDYAEAHNDLGNILKSQGKLEAAAASFRTALDLRPAYTKAHYNLGIVLHEQGRLEEAIASFLRTLTLDPDYVDAYLSLGNSFYSQGKLPEAVDSFRKALTLKPDYVEVYSNLGLALQDQGRLDEAIASYQQALILNPDYTTAHGNLLFSLNYFSDLSSFQYFEEACRFGRKVAAKVTERFFEWSCPTRPTRLRVGLVSGDLQKHPVGYFLENILACIDPARIELVAYPTNQKEDELTARIRPYFRAWNSLHEMQDKTAACLIHDDGVHILLDLAGHTGNNRLPVFAWKPAPVQATWLGYFASTGLKEMDYILVDRVSAPESDQENFTEKFWYLPDTRLCFSPPIEEETEITRLPALDNGYVTFACFQKFPKINDKVLAAWGQILEKLPNSILRLQNLQLRSPVIREQLKGRFARLGIAPHRLILETQVPRGEYLAAHSYVDIILDTFPFTGGTTTCEALWMGVPTLTLTGESMLGRQGASLLSCAGLMDWIAMDIEDYVAKAVAYASDLEKLARLRVGLRQQVLASALMDGSRFARNLEAALWGMWQSWQSSSQSNGE